MKIATYFVPFITIISVFSCTGPLFASNTQKASYYCNDKAIPNAIKLIQNYEVVAYNTVTIPTAFAFSGEKLNYSVTAHPQHKKNKVSINHQTGVIKLKAESQDQFDIKVTAKNICGEISMSFNVKIDEDKG